MATPKATATAAKTPAVKQTRREIAQATKKAASDLQLADEVEFLNTRQDDSGKWYFKLGLENGKTAIVMDDYFDTAVEEGQIEEDAEGEILVNVKHANVWYNADGQLMVTRKGTGGFKF